jgi:hypothetical protein
MVRTTKAAALEQATSGTPLSATEAIQPGAGTTAPTRKIVVSRRASAMPALQTADANIKIPITALFRTCRFLLVGQLITLEVLNDPNMKVACAKHVANRRRRPCGTREC